MKYPHRFIALLFPLSVLFMMFDFLRVYPGVNISVYKIFQIVILYLIVIFLFSNRDLKFSLYNPTFFLLIGFLLLSLILCPISINVNNSLFEIFRLVQFITLALIMFLFLKMVWREQYWIYLSDIILLSAAVAGLSIIMDYLGVTNFYLWYTDRAYRIFEIRNFGILGEANFAAGKLGIFLPLTLFSCRYHYTRGNMIQLIFGLIGSFIILVAIFLTGSRMGGVIAGFTLTVFLIKEVKLLMRVKNVFSVLLVALIIVLVIFTTGFSISTFQNQSNFITDQYLRWFSYIGIGHNIPPDFSLVYRFTLVVMGLEMFIDYPITGVGLGNYPSNIIGYGAYGYIYSHNTFVSILAETGFFGFAAFLALFIQIAKNIYANYRATKFKDFFFYFGVSFLNLTIMLFFLHDFGNKYFWGMFVVLSMFFDYRKSLRLTEPSKLNYKYLNNFGFLNRAN